MVSGGKKRVKDKRSNAANGGDNDYPASRVVVWHSSFNHRSSRHSEIVQSHLLNQQLEVCLPTADGVTLAQSLKWETSFYYEVRTTLAIFISKRFISEYILQGSVYMVVKNVPTDSCNTAMLLPSGELMLLVDRVTYEQMGIVGEKFGTAVPTFCASTHVKQSQRYVIRLDLTANTWTSDDSSHKAYRDRVISCLGTRFDDLEMLVCAYNERGSPRTITFGEDDTIERKRVEVNGDYTHLQSVFLPQFDRLYAEMNSRAVVESEKKKKDLAFLAAVQSTYDWFGVVSCRLTDLLQHKFPDEYVSTFTGISDAFELEQNGQLAAVRWRGLIAVELCNNVLEKVKQAIKSGQVPWAGVMVWGFPDALVSWKQKDRKQTHEHGYLQNGSNHYTIILLPNEEYFLLQALGPHDTTV